MQRRHRHRRNAGPLLVTEIILPKTENPGPSNDCLEKVSVSDLKSEIMQETENTTGGCLIINDHEIKPVGKLIGLEKNAQETYFRGTRQKKRSKRKSKHQKEKNDLSVFEESQSKGLMNQETKTKGIETQAPTEKSLSIMEIIERNKCKKRIRDYERRRKYSDRKNQIKQRLAEQDYIEKFENLAETWLELLKRRSQLKEEGFEFFQPPYRKCRYNNRISIFPKKFWCEDESTTVKKKDAVKKEVDNLTLDELVFVDDESSDDESSYRTRNKT